MGDLIFCQLAADAIGKFTTETAEAEHIIERLKARGDWELAVAQFRCGATPRVVKGIIERACLEITGRAGS